MFDADLRMVAWNQPFLRLLEFLAILHSREVHLKNSSALTRSAVNMAPAMLSNRFNSDVAAARTFRSHYTERVRKA